MKLTYLVFCLLSAGLLCASGGKRQAGKPEVKEGSVTIELQKIYNLSHGTSPEVQAAAAQLENDIRYRQYVDALAVLDKLVNDPGLNAAQKKDVSDLIGQVKQLAQSAPK